MIPCLVPRRRRRSSYWRPRRNISSSRHRRRRLDFSCCRNPCSFRSRFTSIRLPMWPRPQKTSSSPTFTTQPSSTTMPTSSLRARRGRPGLAPPGWRPVLQLARRPARSPRKSLCPHPWPARHQRLEGPRQLRGRRRVPGQPGAAGVPVPGPGAKPGTPPVGTPGAPAAHLPPGHELPGASGPVPGPGAKPGTPPVGNRYAGRASRALAARPRIAGRIWPCPWARRKAGNATCRCTGRASRTTCRQVANLPGADGKPLPGAPQNPPGAGPPAAQTSPSGQGLPPGTGGNGVPRGAKPGPITPPAVTAPARQQPRNIPPTGQNPPQNRLAPAGANGKPAITGPGPAITPKPQQPQQTYRPPPPPQQVQQPRQLPPNQQRSCGQPGLPPCAR